MSRRQARRRTSYSARTKKVPVRYRPVRPAYKSRRTDDYVWSPGAEPARSMPRHVSTYTRRALANLDARTGTYEKNEHPSRDRLRLTYPIRSEKRNKICERRAERRAVLLAIGKVNRPGGAPGKNGHYKKGSDKSCK